MAFRQMLRFVYTGQCEADALEAMAEHLFEAGDKFGIVGLRNVARKKIMETLAPEKVCDAFSLAHAHEDEVLMDACAKMTTTSISAVTQSEGFERLSEDFPQLMVELLKTMGSLKKFGQKKLLLITLFGYSAKPTFKHLLPGKSLRVYDQAARAMWKDSDVQRKYKAFIKTHAIQNEDGCTSHADEFSKLFEETVFRKYLTCT